jgi:hypothetical protein
MTDYKEIYEILKAKYGSVQWVAEAAGVTRNSVRNVLLGITKQGPKAEAVRKYSEQYVMDVLAEKKKKIEAMVNDNKILNEAEALLASTAATN